MNYPLLDYSVNTTPSPLQVDSETEIEIVGQIEDENESPTVILNQLTFALGGDAGLGSSADQFTAAIDPENLNVTFLLDSEPQTWGTDISGNKIKLIPNSTACTVSAGQSITIKISGLQVNGTTGRTKLFITEYSQIPDQTASGEALTQKVNLYKFAADANERSQFWAESLIVEYGNTVQLNWSGDKGVHKLQYVAGGSLASIETHDDGTSFQSNDSYPLAGKDNPILIDRDMRFILTYTPEGETANETHDLTISATYPALEITEFSITPENVLFSDAPQSVVFNWAVNRPDLIGEMTLNGVLIQYDQTGSSSTDLMSGTIYKTAYSANETFVLKVTHKYLPNVSITAEQTLSFWEPAVIDTFTLSFGDITFTLLGTITESGAPIDVYRASEEYIESGGEIAWFWTCSGGIKSIEFATSIMMYNITDTGDIVFVPKPTPSPTDRSCSMTGTLESASYMVYVPGGEDQWWECTLTLTPYAGESATKSIKIIPSNKPFP